MESYTDFNELASGHVTENAPGGVGDIYGRQNVPPPTFTADVGGKKAQPEQSGSWGWAQQRAWNAKAEDAWERQKAWNGKAETAVKEIRAEVKEIKQNMQTMAADIEKIKQAVVPK